LKNPEFYPQHLKGEEKERKRERKRGGGREGRRKLVHCHFLLLHKMFFLLFIIF
jgi:hypothetical protein